MSLGFIRKVLTVAHELHTYVYISIYTHKSIDVYMYLHIYVCMYTESRQSPYTKYVYERVCINQDSRFGCRCKVLAVRALLGVS